MKKGLHPVDPPFGQTAPMPAPASLQIHAPVQCIEHWITTWTRPYNSIEYYL